MDSHTTLQQATPAADAVSGTVFNIQRFCTHDGPGIRTTVFLKGCPLQCPWCHNPEGLERRLQVSYDPERCIACRACAQVCDHDVHTFLDTGEHVYAPERCQHCGACVETCYAGALEMLGEERSATQVMEVVVRDKPFYDNSDGGVTLSGGEPLAQYEFATALLRLSREAGIGTAVETTATVAWERMAALVRLVDCWMCDVKHMDDAHHRRLTGSSNRVVLDNIRRLSSAGVRLLLRFPLVPGLTDDDENLRALGAFAAGIDAADGLEIMPYHRIGAGKYQRIERHYALEDTPEASDDDVRRAVRLLRQAGAARVTCQRLPEL